MIMNSTLSNDEAYKTIYPDAFNFGAGVKTITLLEVVNNKVRLPQAIKRASENSAVDNFVKGLTPEKGKGYIHLVTTGADEFYGPNKRGDAFNEHEKEFHPSDPKPGCEVIILDGGLEKYHNSTFRANGQVYREHHTILDENPATPEGDVAFADYNKPMHRGELVIAVDKDKWSKELDDAEHDSPLYFSIGCLCTDDVCSICGNRVSPNKKELRCEHLKWGNLLQLDSNGNQAKAITDRPIFYDISKVANPADKIAFCLAKVANEDAIITLPPPVMPTSILEKIESRKRVDRSALVYKIASEEKEVQESGLELPVTMSDEEDVKTLKSINKDELPKAMHILKKNNTVLPPTVFLTMMTQGDNEDMVSEIMPIIKEILPTIFGKIKDSPGMRDFLENSSYEGEPTYDRELEDKLDPLIRKYSINPEPIRNRVIRVVVSCPRKVASDPCTIVTPVAVKMATDLALEYARYQLAFLSDNKDDRSIRLTLANNHANVQV